MRITFRTIAILLLFVPLQASLAAEDEFTVKAIFLEKLTQFIDWPSESAMEDTSRLFVLGVIGDSPFGTILEDIYSHQKIKNRRVEIRYLSSIEEIEGCQGRRDIVKRG